MARPTPSALFITLVFSPGTTGTLAVADAENLGRGGMYLCFGHVAVAYKSAACQLCLCAAA